MPANQHGLDQLLSRLLEKISSAIKPRVVDLQLHAAYEVGFRTWSSHSATIATFMKYDSLTSTASNPHPRARSRIQPDAIDRTLYSRVPTC